MDYGFGNDLRQLPLFADFGRECGPGLIGGHYPTTFAELYDIHVQLWEWVCRLVEQRFRFPFFAWRVVPQWGDQRGMFVSGSQRSISLQQQPRLSSCQGPFPLALFASAAGGHG